MQFTTEAVFERPITDDPESDLSRITAYFHTRAFILSEGHSVDFQEVVDVLNELVSNFSTRGSGYVLAYVKSLKISLVPFRPLGASGFGGTYFKTPRWLAVKHAVINVKNNDKRCFLWAILSALYPVDQNAHRVKKYKRYENTLDTRDLEFPVAPNKIHVFERRNPSIAIHCLAYDEKTKSFSVLYMSPEIHKRQHKITLLLLDSQSQALCVRQTSFEIDRRQRQKWSQTSRLSVLSSNLYIGASIEESHTTYSLNKVAEFNLTGFWLVLFHA